MSVGVHEPGHEGLAGQVYFAGVSRDGHLAGRAEFSYALALRQEDAFVGVSAGAVQDVGVEEGCGLRHCLTSTNSEVSIANRRTIRLGEVRYRVANASNAWTRRMESGGPIRLGGGTAPHEMGSCSAIVM